MWLYSSIERMKSVMVGFNWQNKINCGGRVGLLQQDRKKTQQYTEVVKMHVFGWTKTVCKWKARDPQPRGRMS